jgi:hypothetical protein
MKYLLCFILFAFALTVAGVQLYFTHVLTLIPALWSGIAIAACFYLLDPTRFLEFSADMRKSFTARLKGGDA